MVKKILSVACCLALCMPMVAMAQTNDINNSMVVSADTTVKHDFKSSQKVVDLIKSCEGFSKMAYWDYKQWTIGYGTYVSSNTTYPNGITEAQAEQLLFNALVTFEDYVNAFLERNNVSVNQNQFDALVCFTYALPSWSFKGNEDYSIAQMLINGVENYSDQEVYDTFGLYVKAGTGSNKKTLPGLVKRRIMEASLFLYGNTTTEVPLDITTTNNTNTVTTANSNVSSITEDIQNYSSTTTTDTEVELPTYWRVSDKDGIKLRKTYGLNGERLSAIPCWATISVSEIVKADGYTWGKVTYDGITGWCALDYCYQIEDFNTPFDLNADGYFHISDVCMLKGYLAGTVELSDEQLKIADVNGDGKVDNSDYQVALNAIVRN